MVATANQRIWITDDGRFVGDGDPDARFLAAAPDDPLPEGYEVKRAARPADKAVKATPKNKATEPPDEE